MDIIFLRPLLIYGVWPEFLVSFYKFLLAKNQLFNANIAMDISIIVQNTKIWLIFPKKRNSRFALVAVWNIGTESITCTIVLAMKKLAIVYTTRKARATTAERGLALMNAESIQLSIISTITIITARVGKSRAVCVSEDAIEVGVYVGRPVVALDTAAIPVTSI